MPEVPEFPRYLEEQAYKSLLKRVEMCQNDFDWGWDREPKDRRHAMNACLDLERAIERIATLTQQLAEAEARVRVLVNTLDVERDAFRNMQMQKEALEARNKRLATPVSDEQTVWYHGTRPENVDSIKTDGFREGTWFARHMEDAAGYGGSHVFSVRVSFSVDPERWQVCCSNAIPACAIERLSIVTALADERKEAPDGD